MSLKAYLGTYYKTEKEAIKKAKKMVKKTDHNFCIMCFQNGYLVVSERQVL